MDQNRAWEQHVFIFEKIKKKKSVMVSQLYRRKVKNLVVFSFMKKIMRAEKKIDEIGFWAYFDQKVNESNMVYPPKGDAKHIQ